MILIRSLLYAAWSYTALALIIIFFLPWTIFDGRGARAAARAWSAACLWGLDVICGLKLEVRGREYIPHGPALVASKHQSMLDALLPFTLLDNPSIALKRELSELPFFGWYTKRAGMMALDRDAHAAAIRKMVREARPRLAEGRQLFIFPEGTRRKIGAPPEYKSGVAAIYNILKTPCTPVALNTGLFWEGIIRRPGIAIVEFLPPIELGLSRDEFMAQLEKQIETAGAALLPQRDAKISAPFSSRATT